MSLRQPSMNMQISQQDYLNMYNLPKENGQHHNNIILVNNLHQDNTKFFEQTSNFQSEIYPAYDKNQNYYQEFWRVYLQNEILIQQMKEQVTEIKNIKLDIHKLDELCLQLEIQNQSQSDKNQKKKNRRTAAEIAKDYNCPYQECGKQYGSEVSLNLHIKLKHGGGNKTDREKLARQICLAQSSGELLPDIILNLPPGYLEKFKGSDRKPKKSIKKDNNDQSVDQTSDTNFSQKKSEMNQNFQNQIQNNQLDQEDYSEEQQNINDNILNFNLQDNNKNEQKKSEEEEKSNNNNDSQNKQNNNEDEINKLQTITNADESNKEKSQQVEEESASNHNNK